MGFEKENDCFSSQKCFFGLFILWLLDSNKKGSYF